MADLHLAVVGNPPFAHNGLKDGAVSGRHLMQWVDVEILLTCFGFHETVDFYCNVGNYVG